MTPDKLLAIAIVPAHVELANYGIPDTPSARRLSLTIALQETGLLHRRQVTASGLEDGPAVSWWQFESGPMSGCVEVLTHPATRAFMAKVCAAHKIAPTPKGLWEAMRYNDIVAACAARLLFYKLPDALPTEPVAGWDQYYRAWHPGKPHPEKWGPNWKTASSYL